MLFRKLALAAVMALIAGAAVAPAAVVSAKSDKVKAKIYQGVLEITGSNGPESIALRLGSDPTLLEIVVDGSFSESLNRSKFTSIAVDAAGGDDTVAIDETQGPFTTTTPTVLGGGAGADTLMGGSGGETLVGGDGNDSVIGGRGPDVASLGPGDDSFVWNPGDSSDTVDGQGGTDTLVFKGANVGERFDLSANGPRLRLTRDVASIVMDVNGVESVSVNALGGADVVTVNDLSGTNVNQVTTNLGAADGQVDSVVVNGAAAPEQFLVASSSGQTTASGGAARVVVAGAEPVDFLTVNGLAGDDRFTAAQSAASLMGVHFVGGGGTDTAVDQGTAGNDSLDVDPFGGDIVFSGVFANAENVLVNGNDGDDTISASNGLAGLTALTIDGGSGDDTINSGDGADRLLGGEGNDTIRGGRGEDTALLGAGDDTFVWNPGDSNDIVEGQGGTDTLLFNGANVNESFDLSANGTRLRLTRNVASIVMDVDGVEKVSLNALGGADVVTVNDLAGTAVSQVSANPGGTDGQLDNVVVNGTAAADLFGVASASGQTVASGGAAQVVVTGAEPTDTLTVNGLTGDDRFTVQQSVALPVGVHLVGGEGDDIVIDQGTAGNDTMDIDAFGSDVAMSGVIVTSMENVLANGNDGDDTIVASNGLSTLTRLTIDGGNGNDTIIGGDGADTIIGGDGNDSVRGGRGEDSALLGPGDDSFTWNPGDSNDVVEGQAGTDTMVFNGANVSEKFELSTNGSRLRLTRDVASIVMDADDVENVSLNALGGADRVTVNDLGGTDLVQLGTNLGAADAAVDQVVVNGTGGDDALAVTGAPGSATLTGLAAVITISGADGDNLTVNALGGADSVAINDMTGSGITEIDADVGSGDGQVDNVVVDGTAGSDVITVSGLAGSAAVSGIAALVEITAADAATDRLSVNALAGDDVIDASGLAADAIQLLEDGGDGDDVLIGGAGDDTIFGGAGDDVLLGGPGVDFLDGGPGSNIILQD